MGARTVAVLVAIAAVAVVLVQPAWPVEPFRLGDQIEDRVGALGDRTNEVQEAFDDLRGSDGIQLWVAYVDSFSGVGAQEWADRTAELSDLGLSDVLLAVATEDRAYAYSVDEQFPLSDEELARIANGEIEPELSDGDWAGAAVAAADALAGASGDGASGDDDGGGSSWLWPLVGAVVLLGLVWALVSWLRRGRGTSPAAAAEGDELSRLSLDELSKRGSGLLVEVDDAVKTSEQEVAFAAAQFGDETAAPFAAAVESARADLAKAFQLRRALDDSTPEDETSRREMLSEIISLTQGASDRLDAEVDRFDELRAMEQNAPELLAGLATRLSALEGRLPGAEATLGGLTATYAPAAVASVLDNPRQAGERLAFARGEVTEGNAEVAAGNRGKAAVAIRGAEEAVGQAGQLVDAIDRLATDLADADDKIRAAIPGVVEDITAARALAGQNRRSRSTSREASRLSQPRRPPPRRRTGRIHWVRSIASRRRARRSTPRSPTRARRRSRRAAPGRRSSRPCRACARRSRLRRTSSRPVAAPSAPRRVPGSRRRSGISSSRSPSRPRTRRSGWSTRAPRTGSPVRLCSSLSRTSRATSRGRRWASPASPAAAEAEVGQSVT